MPTIVEFTEEMKGHVARGESDCERGDKTGTLLMVHLTIRTEDIDYFLTDPKHRGFIKGYVDYGPSGGKCDTEGEFDCLVTTGINSRKMFYRLFFRDSSGAMHTLSGVKDVSDDGIQNIWRDTSTLFTKIFAGQTTAAEEEGLKPEAAGIIRIAPLDFMTQLTTFRARGSSLETEAEAIVKFGRFFLLALWDVYKPRAGSIYSHDDRRRIPLFTMSGIRDAEISNIHFSTPDMLGLQMLRFRRMPCSDVVVLLHGLTTSTDMFIMPEHYNIVNYLHDNGYTDVWSLDWRGSMRYSYDLFPAKFTMDDIALFDMPAAFSKIREIAGPDVRIHVICHCVGSMTFMMSLCAGLVHGISSVVSNAVSLTPRVPGWCRIKLALATTLLPQNTDFNPRWSYYPGFFSIDKWLSSAISLFHEECKVPACHVVSFMWGSGHPAAWLHENLHEVTHQRTGDLFGSVNINYYHHVLKMVTAGAAVKMYPEDPRYDRLPDNYLDQVTKLSTPVLFVTGKFNRVFTDSNIVTFKTIQERNPANRCELKVFDTYGHQDPFMGKSSDKEVFPVFLDFLQRHSVGHPET